MDVDLRQFVALPAATAVESSTAVDRDDRQAIELSKMPHKNKHSSTVVDSDVDSSDDGETAPPFAKKSKSEKIDM